MRLLDVHTLAFRQFHGDDVPRYAIASHRWVEAEEVTTKDLVKKRNTEKSGYKKVEGFAQYVRENITHLQWLWIDTCCIDQSSSQEVSEAIRAMYRYYSKAEVCLAYLMDVTAADNLDEFRTSSWFKRGWTLQELLAPHAVMFLNHDWQLIGHKGGDIRSRSGHDLPTGPSLGDIIAAVAGIPEKALEHFDPKQGFAVEQKLEWMKGRETLRGEDLTYCLLGIFNVTLGVEYGEGRDEARKRLLAEIYKGNNAHETRSGQPDTGTSRPMQCFCNVPFRRDPDFVDRGTLLDDIQGKLYKPAGRAALVGLGGAGKSQLAIETAYRLRDRSQVQWILWVYASNAARYEQGMRDIADQAKIEGRENPSANIFKLVRDWLFDRSTGSWVLILDNVDDASFLARHANTEGVGLEGNSVNGLFEYIPVCDHGSILITSRRKDAALSLVENADIVAIHPMDQHDAMSLLEKKLPADADKEDCAELANAVDYMPLALTQAAAYITQSNGRTSVRKYLGKLQQATAKYRTKKGVLDHEFKDVRRNWDAKSSIILSWEISFEQIREIRPSAADLLSLMSLCDRQAIPQELLLNRKSRDERDDEQEESMNHDEYEEQSPSNMPESDKDDSSSDASSDASFDGVFDEDIRMLQAYSFVSLSSNGAVLEMHRLVQLATLRWLESQGRLERFEEIFFDNVYELFPDATYENWGLWQELWPHLKAVERLKLRGYRTSIRWATMLYSAAIYAHDRGNLREAKEMAQLSYDIRFKLWGDTEQTTLMGRGLLVAITRDLGLLQEALTLSEQNMTASVQLLGEEHPQSLLARGHLASAYHVLGRYDEAEEMYLSTLKLRQRLLGMEHEQTLTNMNNLANTYSKQLRYDESVELNLQTVEIRTRLLGTEHPDTIRSMGNLAASYMCQGRFDEGQKLQLQVVETRTRLLGPDHPDTLVSMTNLAYGYYEEGRYEEALKLGSTTLEIQKRTLGPEHPDTLLSMENLAAVYTQAGWDIEETEKLERHVLESHRRVLGSQHPDTLWSIGNLAALLRRQGRRQSAYELAKEAAAKTASVLGKEHPLAITRQQTVESLEAELSDAGQRSLSDHQPKTSE